MTPILTFKTGVTLASPPTPAGSRILGTVERAARQFGTSLEVTSGTDSHTAPDPHALGEAFDVSVAGLTAALVVALYHWLVTELGPQFCVQYEAPVRPADAGLLAICVVNVAASGPHLHVQRAKGTVYPPAPPAPGTTV